MDPKIDKEKLKSFTMYYQAMQEEKPPRKHLYLYIALTGIAIVILGLYIYSRYVPGNVINHERDKTKIVQQIDSLQAKRSNITTGNIKHSQSQAAKADSLFKTLKNEKTVIPDTTYTAMCEYVANYRYPTTIEAE